MDNTKEEALQELFTKKCRIVLHNDNIVTIEGGREVEITEVDAEECKEAIERELTGDYGYLLNRINEYSVAYKTYEHLNNNERLKCVAVVTYRKNTEINLPLEKNFFTKPVQGFQDIASAKAWLAEKLGSGI